MSGSEPARDRWRWRQIAFAGAVGGGFAEIERVLEFWPLGVGSMRGLIDLGRIPLGLSIAVAGLILTLIAAIDLFRRRFRSCASGMLAVAALPTAAIMVARLTVFDPWFYYAWSNVRRLEADPSGFSVGATWDVSTGIAGVNPNQFVTLVYDRSDEVGLAPEARSDTGRQRLVSSDHWHLPLPSGRRLFDHVFRVDSDGS